MRLPLILISSACLSVAATAPTTSVANLPLAFEELAGGRLAARQGQYALELKARQIAVAVTDRARKRSATVVTKFAGANPSASPAGEDVLPGRANYLIGSDASQWRTGVPVYHRAVYRDVYPGIDLMFHGTQGALEYDFVVKPGKSASAIAMDVSGAEGMRVDAEGALIIHSAAGDIRWKKPSVYQWRDGTREPVAGEFHLRGHRVTFALGSYDRSRDLVIDPTLVYATYIGGSDAEGARGVAVDASGNFYVTGFTFSVNLPHTGGSSQQSYKGGTQMAYLGGDAFAAKYTSGGSLVYVTYLGGSLDDIGSAIAVDSAGNAYITGVTDSSNFPTTSGAFQTKYGGDSKNNFAAVLGDAFVTKLNPTGTALVYSTYLGGAGDDIGAAIAVDSAGNAYVGGATRSANFPTANAFQGAFKGTGGNPDLCSGCGPIFAPGDGFVAKLNAAGSTLLWSTFLGGAKDDSVASIAIDSSGAVYAAGATLSSDFPTSSGAYQTAYGGGLNTNSAQPVITTGDGFVTKFDSNGKLVYSTYLGGSGDDAVMGIALDSTGAAYVTGFTTSANLAPAAVLHGSFKGPATITGQRGFVWGDAFAAKLAPNGSSLIYATYVGGSKDDAGMALVVDSAGEAIIGGFANSTDMTLSSDALQKQFGGILSGYTDDTGDAFLAKLSADGATVLYNSYFGGAGDEAISGMAMDSAGNVIVAGPTTSTNLKTTSNAAQPNFGGGGITETMGDGFVVVFSGLGSVVNAATISAVVNAASLDTRLAPGTRVLVNGTNLPTTTSTTATVGTQAATVVSASATQWILVIPTSAAAGATTVQIGTSNAFSITLTAFAPALFSTTNDGKGVVAATKGAASVSASAPALPGDSIVLTGTGFGAATTANTVVNIGGQNVTPSLVGATSGGNYQLTFTVPANIAAGNPNISVTVGGAASNTLTIPVGAVAIVPVITAVQNGGSYVDGFPSGAWLQIKGTNLASVASDTWANAIVNGALPTLLDGVTVTVGGQPAYVYFVSPGQINVVAPNIAAGPTTVVVKNSLGASAAFNTTANALQPAFFPWPNGQVVASHYPDFSFAVKNGTFAGLATVAAKPGDVIILWGTGFGSTTPAAPVGQQVPATATFATSNSVTVTIGSQSATVYGAALAPGFAALYQIAIQVPANLPNGDYPIVATVTGVSSPNTAILTVQQ